MGDDVLVFDVADGVLFWEREADEVLPDRSSTPWRSCKGLIFVAIEDTSLGR